ncbi:MAG: hypothetical protein KDC54_24355 [Lewinella sp.]|nr:hypothetical protein [Lewinella sp.]
MDQATLRMVSSCLQGSRRLFSYGPEEYALYLLGRQVQDEPRKLSELKDTPWARLLERPLLKQARGQWGDGLLSSERLAMLQSPDPCFFRLTFGEWGDKKQQWRNWQQTSRPGYNLVLQLNFNTEHNQHYAQLLDRQIRRWHPFHYGGHPARASQEFTLAWARIDLAEDLSAALIEEIQTDWLRAAREEIVVYRHKQRDASGQWREWTEKKSRHALDLKKMEHYLQQILSPYEDIWAPAMLLATIQLLWEEIGVEKIYYHTYDTGCLLKNCRPPRSLYTSLPKRFCFAETETIPGFLWPFLRKDRRLRGKTLRFWELA